MKWIGKLILLCYLVVVVPALIVLMGGMAYGFIVESVKYLQSK